jgi:hypothetical protein
MGWSPGPVLAGGGGGGGTFLLDVLGVSATRAYSTRKLRSAYAGSAIRIRRSSDNAEQDIGFSGENLDTAAITTFVGANSAFIAKWYDQSGNADDAVNATAATQPPFVVAGVLPTKNGKATVGPFILSATPYVVTSAVSTPIKTYGLVCAVNEAGPTVSNWRGAIAFTTTTAVAVIQQGTGVWSTGFVGTPSVDGIATNNVVFGGALANVRSTSATGQTGIVQIGTNNVGTNQNFVGWISEAVMFDIQLSAPNYATLYANQQAYWGTPAVVETFFYPLQYFAPTYYANRYFG